MARIIRSKEEIRALIEAMTKELEGLPAYNLWGESTEDSKEETRQWIAELQLALDEGCVEDEWDSEIAYWLTNEKSFFAKDYGL